MDKIAENPAQAEPETMVDVLVRYERACSRESNPGYDVSEHLRGAIMAMVNYDLYCDGAKHLTWSEFIAARAERSA